MAEPGRVRPETTADTDFFWRAGHDGVLRILGCTHCDYLIHPPAPYCPACGSRAVAPRDVSGDASVYSFTLLPTDPPGTPATVAIVELAEQSDLRLMSNIVDCDSNQVRIGMPLRVTFEPCEDLMIPVFKPLER